jgi:hypothetical protein
MYCSNCGTQLSDDANFCYKCGKPQSVTSSPKVSQSDQSIEWEYWTWEAGIPSGIYIPSIKGKYGDRAHYGDQTNRTPAPSNPEPFARLQFWQQIQSRVLPVIQRLRDEGWEPITEVGPAALILDRGQSKDASGFFKALVSDIIDPGWKLFGLSIQFRRQKGSGKYSVAQMSQLITKAGY